MPIFEYRCRDCSNCFEKLVLKKGQVVSCPDCGSENIERLFSSFGVRMKGDGGSSSSECSTCNASSCRICGK